jgi:hypothetical protein
MREPFRVGVPIAIALLLSLGLGGPVVASDERPLTTSGQPQPNAVAPGDLAQAPAQTDQASKPEAQASKPEEPPEPQTPTAAFGPAWRFSSTGRQIADPTGTRFFRPAVSGGTGVTAW